jgi:hypothetical protein
MVRAISYLLPNFQNFNVTGAVTHARGVPGTLVLHVTLYTLVYSAVVLTGASAVFSRRNLK